METKKGRIVILIPVFNEEETLAVMLSSVPKTILGHEITMVVVDDGSTDQSAFIASNFTQHIVMLVKNNGVGFATKRGLEYILDLGIDFDCLIKFDADGQHDPSFLSQMVEELQKNDIVICSRFHPLSNQSHTPIDRIILNCVFSSMVRRITRWELTDVRSGYMGFRFELVRKIVEALSVKRYGIPMEILLRIWGVKKDARICEISHPALYDTNISVKLSQKYTKETILQKTTRLQDAYGALLQVISEMGISKEYILEINGYKNY